MKFIYCDSGLKNNLGHHANSCRAITAELRQKNIPVFTVAQAELPPELASELTASPLFRIPTYALISDHPLCGWLLSFQVIAEITAEDLARIQGVGPEDILYFNSVEAPQLYGLVLWAQKTFSPANCPHIIAEFGRDTGHIAQQREDGSLAITLRDQRPVMYSYTSQRILPQYAPKFHLITFDTVAAQGYEQIMERRVMALPLPQRPTTSCRRRVGQSPITISFLGHQRGVKGFALAPAIIQQLLQRHGLNIRILAHNGSMTDMLLETQQLQAMATLDNRLQVVHATANDILWAQLLEQSDLIVLPYHQARFATSYSAVAAEAIANAIVQVVPDNTSMSVLLAEHDFPGLIFPQSEVDDIVKAVDEVLANYDLFAHKAAAASALWCQKLGASQLVDSLLAIVNPPTGLAIAT